MNGFNKDGAVSCGLPTLVLLIFASSAQSERLPIKFYTTADGLAHNQINKIVRLARVPTFFLRSSPMWLSFSTHAPL